MNVARSRKISPRKLMIALLSSVFALALGGLTTMFYVATRSHATPNATAPILGTWARDEGAIINFRPDGTARVRISKNDRKLQYCEWTLDENNELRIFHQVSDMSKLWKSNVNNWVFGQHEPNLSFYQFLLQSDNEMELVMTMDDGEETVLVFTATSDAKLEASP